jgi:hypothetical protein
MTVKQRQDVERRIARAFLEVAHSKGYTFKIDNGGDDDEMIRTEGVEPTLSVMFATDEDRVYILKHGREVGWVYFVYGNDGYDVVCDYTTNLDDLGLLVEANEIVED